MEAGSNLRCSAAGRADFVDSGGYGCTVFARWNSDRIRVFAQRERRDLDEQRGGKRVGTTDQSGADLRIAMLVTGRKEDRFRLARKWASGNLCRGCGGADSAKSSRW